MTIERTSYTITKDKRGKPIEADHATTILEPRHSEFVAPFYRIYPTREAVSSSPFRVGVYVRDDETLVLSPEGRPHAPAHSDVFTREAINSLENERHHYFMELKGGEVTQRGVRFSWRPTSVKNQ
jgi:hypothetical protein